jgi:amino acid transporter
MYSYLVLQALSVVVGAIALFLIVKGLLLIRKRSDRRTRGVIDTGVVTLLIALVVFAFSSISYPLHFAMPPMMQAMTKDRKPASLPIASVFSFLANQGKFEKVADIGRDPNDVPPPVAGRGPETVRIAIRAKEVNSEIAAGIVNNYWPTTKRSPDRCTASASAIPSR